jgi:aspartate carbamoyltransferase catalytic subunit
MTSKESSIQPREAAASDRRAAGEDSFHQPKRLVILNRPLFLYVGPAPLSIARSRLKIRRAAYFRQVEYGLYVRMALLVVILGKA